MSKYINYLFENRKKSNLFSRLWFKDWGKRLFNFGGLCKILFRIRCLSKKGAQIGPLSVISAKNIEGSLGNLVVGRECTIGHYVTLVLHDKIILGDNVVINDGCKLLTASHDINCPEWTQTTAPITINDYAWIASNVIVLPGVTIGKGAVVGAGSVVTKSVFDFQVVGGNPAKFIKERTLKNISHSPVRWLAPFEAWLGNS